jgi:hypothetical protein
MGEPEFGRVDEGAAAEVVDDDRAVRVGEFRQGAGLG